MKNWSPRNAHICQPSTEFPVCFGTVSASGDIWVKGPKFLSSASLESSGGEKMLSLELQTTNKWHNRGRHARALRAGKARVARIRKRRRTSQTPGAVDREGETGLSRGRRGGQFHPSQSSPPMRWGQKGFSGGIWMDQKRNEAEDCRAAITAGAERSGTRSWVGGYI